MDTNKETKARTHSSARRWILLLVLVVLVAGLGFVIHRQNISLGEAFRAARSVSGEAAATASVKAALALSRKVSAFDIDVDTQGGVVRLSGRVPSDEVRRLAVAIAADTSGVARVEDQLMIDESARPDPEIVRLERRVADLEIETAVAAALARHPELREYEVEVEVAGGTVTLSGTVPDPAARYGAEALSSEAEGVASVTNDIEVSGSSSARETATAEEASERGSELARKVEFELFKTDAFDLNRMTIRGTAPNVVALEGMARSEAERLLAERIAASVDGVDRVINELEVIAISPEA